MLPRVFSHVAEFNEAGYQSIPALAFVAEPLILWSPSGSQIKSAADDGLSILGPDDLLSLVTKGFVRIHGREEWLTSQAHRESRWEETKWAHARWSDFDERVREIADEDREKPEGEKRVRFAEPDVGGGWAEEQVENETEAAAVVRALVGDRQAVRALPPGTREKIEDADDDEVATKVVLRDIHNHAAAFSEARALSVEPPEFAPLIAELATEVIEERDPSSLIAPPPSLGETVELFTELLWEREAPSDLSEVEELLAWKTRDPRVQLEIGSMLAEPSSAAWLDAEIAKDKAARTAWDELFPADSWDFDRCLIFIAALMAGFEATDALEAVALYRFLPRSLAAGKALGRGASSADDYAGPRVPFLLAHGSATPTYAQIGQMRDRLQAFLVRVSG